MGRQIPELLALPPIAVICLLLNLGGIETATGTDSDADRDLRANGLAAILCGALGGVLGITSVNRTLLMFRMGVRGRRASVFGGLAGLVLPLLWPALLGLVPRPVLGSVLLFYGLGMLQEWGLRARRQLSWPEWLTVLVVLAIAVRFGLIAAAFAGLLLGCITFAVIYSRTSPIRARYRGGAARSFVDRSAAELAQLAAAAPSILVIHLDGFVFFGTASRLVDEVKREISATQGVLRHLVLDFADVGGIDGSARVSFERLLRIAAAEGIALVLTAMSESVGAALTTVPRPPQAQLLVARSLEEGLELCEERVLANMPPAAAQSVTAQLAAEFDCPEDAARFIRLLEAEDIPAGGVLMRQGEHSDDLLFIAHGRASVTVQFGIGTPMRVRSFGSGTMVGEIGFCLGLPRTATVQAEQDCRILRLSRAAYQRLEIEHPTVVLALQRAVMRRLANRLLDKDQLIAALMNGATRVSDPGG
jgi:SulP family sulfate permease